MCWCRGDGVIFTVSVSVAGFGVSRETQKIASKMNAPAIRKSQARLVKGLRCVSDIVYRITAPSDKGWCPNRWCKCRSDTRSRSHRTPDGDTYFEWYADRRIVHTSNNHCHSENTTRPCVPSVRSHPNNPSNPHPHRQQGSALAVAVAVSLRSHHTSPNSCNYTANYNETCNPDNLACCLRPSHYTYQSCCNYTANYNETCNPDNLACCLSAACSYDLHTDTLSSYDHNYTFAPGAAIAYTYRFSRHSPKHISCGAHTPRYRHRRNYDRHPHIYVCHNHHRPHDPKAVNICDTAPNNSAQDT